MPTSSARTSIASVALIVAVAAIRALGQETKRNHYENDTGDTHTPANHTSHSTNERRRKFPPFHKYKEYDHPTEDQQRTAEQFFWKKSVRLNWFILVISVIAAGFAFASFLEVRRQADIAHDTLIASQRPWIALQSPSVVSGLSYDDNGLIVYFSTKIKNIGHTPALRTEFSPYMFFSTTAEGFHSEAVLKEKCDILLPSQIPAFGIVFPETEPESAQPVGIYISHQEIEQNRVGLAELNKLKTPPDFIGTIYVAFCIAYESEDGSVHRTGRMYNLLKIGPGGTRVGFRYKEIVQPGSLALGSEISSSYAN